MFYFRFWVFSVCPHSHAFFSFRFGRLSFEIDCQTKCIRMMRWTNLTKVNCVNNIVILVCIQRLNRFSSHKSRCWPVQLNESIEKSSDSVWQNCVKLVGIEGIGIESAKQIVVTHNLAESSSNAFGTKRTNGWRRCLTQAHRKKLHLYNRPICRGARKWSRKFRWIMGNRNRQTLHNESKCTSMANG